MKCNTLNIVAIKIKVALLGFGSWHNKKKKKEILDRIFFNTAY